MPVKISIIKNTGNQMLMRMWKERNPCALLLKLQIVAATVKNSIKEPEKIKYKTTI